MTGTVTATEFVGGGSGLTGVGESIGPWYYNPEVNDSLVNLNVGIGITFSKKILPGSSGTATLKIVNAGTAGTTIQSWGISSATIGVTDLVLGSLVSPLVVNQTYQLDIPSGFIVDTNSSDYAGTAYTFAARPLNNELYTFGAGEMGQLSQNSTINRSSPVQVTGTIWQDGKSTPNQTRSWLLGTTDGTLYAVGVNNYGQLGQNNRDHRSSPTQIPGTTWSGVVGAANGCFHATKTNGTLWAWGRNNSGQLGLNQAGSNNYSSPVQIPGTNWITGQGKAAGTVGNGMSHKAEQMFVLKTNGTLWSWGSNQEGQLGQNNRTQYSSPVQIPGTTWDGIYAGGAGDSNNSIYATKTDGTGWVWGSNHSGQLGLNQNNTFKSSPTQLPGTDWASFGSNAYSRTAYCIKTNGDMFVMGAGHYGQLGLNEGGSPTKYSSPVQLPGSWSMAEGAHGGVTVAVKTDGTLWSWGFNQLGGAGHNQSGPSAPKYSSPVQVGTDTDWVLARHSDEATYAFKER